MMNDTAQAVLGRLPVAMEAVQSEADAVDRAVAETDDSINRGARLPPRRFSIGPSAHPRPRNDIA